MSSTILPIKTPGRIPGHLANSRNGFSIVELLVVVAILLIILSILAPALSGVSAAGRSTQCRSNLRQMAIGATQYALEYGYFPPAVHGVQVEGAFQIVSWDWVTTFSGEVLSPGALWQFTDVNDQVFQCPEYHGPPTGDDPFTGYNYNTTYLGGEGPLISFGDPSGWRDFRPGERYSRCRRTASCAMFGCGGRKGNANKYMRAPLNTVELNLGLVYSGGQAFRHADQTNVAYIDGHVSSVQYAYPGTLATDSLLQEVMGFPQNGFLSNDDRAYNPR